MRVRLLGASQGIPKDKKYAVEFDDGTRVAFGARGYSDFTRHRDEARRRRYLARHRGRENWTRSGMRTPGFWARWLLWHKPSVAQAKRAIAKRFGVTFVARRLN